MNITDYWLFTAIFTFILYLIPTVSKRWKLDKLHICLTWHWKPRSQILYKCSLYINKNRQHVPKPFLIKPFSIYLWWKVGFNYHHHTNIQAPACCTYVRCGYKRNYAQLFRHPISCNSALGRESVSENDWPTNSWNFAQNYSSCHLRTSLSRQRWTVGTSSLVIRTGKGFHSQRVTQEECLDMSR